MSRIHHIGSSYPSCSSPAFVYDTLCGFLDNIPVRVLEFLASKRTGFVSLLDRRLNKEAVRLEEMAYWVEESVAGPVRKVRGRAYGKNVRLERAIGSGGAVGMELAVINGGVKGASIALL